ncbi:MAG TPA: lysophospholipid acyltransferase family protein [Burkholderiales bacterium]|nr:lysophospholipid acyltransferase family protein [Burkholderiales bacterium]
MTLVRSALYQLILVVVVIPYCVLVYCTAPLPRLVRWRVIAGWPQFAFWLSRHLLRIDYEVRGAENIPREPCVILSKHQSAWETIAYTTIFPPHVYVIKRELLWLPFLGWGLGLMSPIAIDRASRKVAMQRMIQLGGERLGQGFSIMVYPEGTRIPVGRRGIYKLGGAVIAVNNAALALPVAHNAGLLWPRNSFTKRPGRVTVVIGPPIPTEGLTAEQVMRRAEEWIEGEMARLTPPDAVQGFDATRAAVPR